jgi:hypothetical protein
MNQASPIRPWPAAPAAGSVKRVIITGLLLTIAMVALLAATQLINYGVFDLRYGAFDTDRHTSVFGFASLLAQLLAAAVIAWRASRVERQRWAWVALSVLVAALVLVRVLTTFSAKTLAAPLACVFLLVCWLTWRDRIAGRAVVYGALVLMMASVVLHQVGLDADVLNYSNQSWAYQFTAVAKHGCELAGWILLATGIIAGFADRRASQPTSAEVITPINGFGRAVPHELPRRSRA